MLNQESASGLQRAAGHGKQLLSFGFAFVRLCSYVNNADYSLTLTTPINAQSVPVCYLNFWNRYSLESGWDFGLVEVSSNNGSTWQQVISYTGINLNWTEQSFDITP
jgi:bacillopeptidase F